MYTLCSCLNRFREHLDEFCAWAIEFHIIKKPDRCHICGAHVGLHCRINEDTEELNTFRTKHSAKWICTNDRAHRKTIFSESIFFKSKMPFENLLILMLFFI